MVFKRSAVSSHLSPPRQAAKFKRLCGLFLQLKIITSPYIIRPVSFCTKILAFFVFSEFSTDSSATNDNFLIIHGKANSYFHRGVVRCVTAKGWSK